MPRELRRKLVIVGDHETGKTSLFTAFALGRFPEKYVPSIFEAFVADRKVNGYDVELALWDTMAGTPDFDRIRPLNYPDTHVVLLCFSVDSQESFDGIEEHWIKELRHFLPFIPILLVATKTDLRYDAQVVNKLSHSGRHLITPEEGSMLARKIGATHYCETSAKQILGVQDTFHRAMQATVREEESGCCLVM
ncbi:uncharacterized protein LACBIDRAFT_192093 [Laccaria bicolor S238N-H82]|uniref:Predicted protein n=1 Tax=Laccaria bicolor (strain S238N-H82 / ATCC MYA-4686) TaxID=486041 RepID=B0DYQ6_LACBS|nr:uncharacterized protein LACBIDRAFT_192093 [Laccaria bicolor S238N-H82]EDR00290.1 predicted protein [Laccaria bicolor S238N-H82]|eukprot:XP_001889042.1 predicted protein [Laccaria bicolor S238N-H82]